MSSISVVVPVYNSCQILPELTSRLVDVLRAGGSTFEVIFVNDGSRDNSWQAIGAAAALYPWVRGVNLMRNYGQHNALLAGIRRASNEIIITLDDDLQNPPEEIPRLVAKLNEGFDVVYGRPRAEQHGIWRNLASRITKLALQGAIGAETARQASAFRAFRRELCDAFSNYQSSYVSLDVLLTWATTRFSSTTVQHDPRRIGMSNYTFRRLVLHAMNMVTGFSTWPLQLASLIGFGLTIFGLAVLAYVVGRYIVQGGSVPGFPFLASVISIFSGAQLFALGIIGEYLSRMYLRSMDRPAYAVREELNPRV